MEDKFIKVTGKEYSEREEVKHDLGIQETENREGCLEREKECTNRYC